MIIDNDTLMKEFYNENKDKFPNITLKQMKVICYTPWRFTKEIMESGSLGTIRLKYFGTFQVYEGRAKSMLKKIKKDLDKKNISKERYLELKTMLDTYIKLYYEKE